MKNIVIEVHFVWFLIGHIDAYIRLCTVKKPGVCLKNDDRIGDIKTKTEVKGTFIQIKLTEATEEKRLAQHQMCESLLDVTFIFIFDSFNKQSD